MQQSGTLRKRKRRNLAKVHGLSVIPYNEALDSFPQNQSFQQTIDRVNKSIKIQISARALEDYSRTRVTRQPSFHPEFQPSTYTKVDIVPETGSTPVEHPLQHRNNKSLQERSHFLDKYTMQRLGQLLWLGTTSGLFPWKWNERDYRIDKWNKGWQKLWWLQWYFVKVQFLFIGLFQFYIFLQNFSSSNTKTNREIFMSSFVFFRYNYVMYFNYHWYKYKDKTQAYINSLLKFNHEMVQKYVLHLDGWQDAGRWLINFAVLVNIAQVFISVSLFLVMPYQPWYLTSYVYPKPFYWLIPGAIQEYMLVGQIIASYMLLAWCMVAHTNTLRFWLTEIHNLNDSDYTVDELRSCDKAFEIYRALQVLNKCFNECLAPIGIPMVKIVMSTALIPCGYVLVRSMDRKFIDEFPGILVYPMAVTDCSIAGFVTLSMAAEVYDLGSGFIDSWSRTKHKDFRRILMSCPSMKIWVTRFYFITVSTTVTFFKVVFDFITDLIIAFP